MQGRKLSISLFYRYFRLQNDKFYYVAILQIIVLKLTKVDDERQYIYEVLTYKQYGV
jgi:hypothetical protein